MSDHKNELIQLIEGNEDWCDDLDTHLAKWDFTKKGFDYWAVSILGCQSSGKSTLLNLLFGTSFLVMDSSRGRTQTTQGIWLGHSFNGEGRSILVLDVEGTDGRERGEEQRAFERKSSLFSLALAEILIINLWMTDIGRYNAANYGLLKTVFELNLQLFARSDSPKTLLLFIIRDHMKQVTPLEMLQATLEKDLATIWNELIKPDQFKNSNVRDFFDLEFTSLPNKPLMPDAFEQEVKQLRSRFVDKTAPDYIFKSAYHKAVPADGWGMYARKIWEVVKDNRDLDLPTQREMLAMYRCDEIMATVHKQFQTQVAPLKEKLENKKTGPVADFGATIQGLLEQAIKDYDEPASRYHKEVADKKRAQLRSKIRDELYSLFIVQLNKIREQTSSKLETQLKELTPKDQNEYIRNFAKTIGTLKKELLGAFQKAVDESLLPVSKEDKDEGSEGGWHQVSREVEEMEDQVSTRVKALEEEHIQRFLNSIENKFKHILLGSLNKFLDSAQEDMWTRIGKLFTDMIGKSVELLQQGLQNEFEISDQARIEKLIADLKVRGFGVVKQRMKEKKENLLSIMERKFHQFFLLDDNGLPRRWNPNDDIPSIYTVAREAGLRVLDLFSIIRLDPSHASLSFLKENPDVVENEEIIILTLDECEDFRARFNKDAETKYVQAVREQEHISAPYKIPTPFIFLLLILGFNEFWMLITNPFLLILAIIVGVAAFTAWFLGFADVPLQVADQVSNNALRASKAWVVNKAVGMVINSPSSGEEKVKAKED